MVSRLSAGLAVLLLGWAPPTALAAKKKPKPDSTAAEKTAPPKTSKKPARAKSQSTPSTDRYKQIQEALASKGYLSQDQANGQWGDASVDALKRFQADQKIESTGRINSLSLIALGLGPKHEATPAGPPPTP